MMFVTNGKQSAELTRNTGEWWYKNKRWSSKNPEDMQEFDRVDMREDTIYFVITTRFYDGDTGNDVHCWDDSQANNPDSDPAWRGDFKGLIDKLDYIKARIQRNLDYSCCNKCVRLRLPRLPCNGLLNS